MVTVPRRVNLLLTPVVAQVSADALEKKSDVCAALESIGICSILSPMALTHWTPILTTISSVQKHRHNTNPYCMNKTQASNSFSRQKHTLRNCSKHMSIMSVSNHPTL